MLSLSVCKVDPVFCGFESTQSALLIAYAYTLLITAKCQTGAKLSCKSFARVIQTEMARWPGALLCTMQCYTAKDKVGATVFCVLTRITMHHSQCIIRSQERKTRCQRVRLHGALVQRRIVMIPEQIVPGNHVLHASPMQLRYQTQPNRQLMRPKVILHARFHANLQILLVHRIVLIPDDAAEAIALLGRHQDAVLAMVLVRIAGSREIRPEHHQRLGQRDLRFGVVVRKVTEAIDERRTEHVGQIFAVHGAHALR